jgi:hypothetical protein
MQAYGAAGGVAGRLRPREWLRSAQRRAGDRAGLQPTVRPAARCRAQDIRRVRARSVPGAGPHAGMAGHRGTTVRDRPSFRAATTAAATHSRNRDRPEESAGRIRSAVDKTGCGMASSTALSPGGDAWRHVRDASADGAAGRPTPAVNVRSLALPEPAAHSRHGSVRARFRSASGQAVVQGNIEGRREGEVHQPHAGHEMEEPERSLPGIARCRRPGRANAQLRGRTRRRCPIR